MKRKICIVTGTRGEYGILKPLLEKIKNSSNLELKLIISGMHLLKKYGYTIKEIERDGFCIDAIVNMYGKKSLDKNYHANALAKGIEGFAKALLKIKPNILVVFGDRLEPLAATLAASTLRIPIAHIQGGDNTKSGHIDESIRHSISQYAHIHFSATKEHSKRLLKMGQESWRIFEVGSLGLDSIRKEKFIKKKELFKEFNINLNELLAVCIFHPLHLEAEFAGKYMHEILESLNDFKIQSVVIYPNNDKGSDDIIKEIEKFRNNKLFKIFPSLSHSKFLNILKYADVLIGNSSSGIIETPSLGLSVLNVGLRNFGRQHANNVKFLTIVKKNKIIKVLNFIFNDKKFKVQVKKCKNPYGDGHSSQKITKVLNKIKLNDELLRKINT